MLVESTRHPTVNGSADVNAVVSVPVVSETGVRVPLMYSFTPAIVNEPLYVMTKNCANWGTWTAFTAVIWFDVT